MRLIDADALIKDLEIWYKEVGHETPRDRLIQNIITYAMDAVNDAESIDAEPVRHGEWIHDINNLYGCSECFNRETMSLKRLKPYCPNCGAMMDGGKE